MIEFKQDYYLCSFCTTNTINIHKMYAFKQKTERTDENKLRSIKQITYLMCKGGQYLVV